LITIGRYALYATTQALYPSSELVCVAAANDIPEPLADAVQKTGAANLNILLKTPQNADTLSSVAPWTAAYPIPTDGVLYYLCQNGSCAAPTQNLDEVLQSLARRS
jgi:uncharacterized protein YyaL (SSP411 family)